MLIVSTQCFPPSAGGIENLVYSLTAQIFSSGEELQVYSDHTNNPGQERFDNSVAFKVNRYSGFKPLRRRNKARDILKYIKSCKYDSARLLTDSWKSLEIINPDYFKTIVCLTHGSELPANPSSSKLVRINRSLSKASTIIANSNFTAGRLKPYVTNSDKIRVIHPGIEKPSTDLHLQKRIKHDLLKHQNVVITIARLEKRKGHKSILYSLPGLIKKIPSLLYIIIGDGPQRQSLEKMVIELRLEGHVRFIGNLDGPEKNAYLANSHLYVMPGSIVGDDVEGFGIAYIEAGYFGIPCVACKIGGAPEAVLHNQTGIVCQPGDTAQLEHTILDLLLDQKVRRKFGYNARARAVNFLWDKKIHEYKNTLFS